MVQVVHAPASQPAGDKTEKTAGVLKKLRERAVEEEASRLGARLGLPYLDLGLFPIDPDEIVLLPKEEAQAHALVLFKKDKDQVYIATAAPEKAELAGFLQKLENDNGWHVRLFVASRPALEQAWTTYDKRPFLENLDMMRIALQGKDLEDFDKNFGALLKLKQGFEGVSTTHIMETIMAGAIKMRASDVHIEPDENDARLRYRLDGLLQDIGRLPREVYRLALSRIKMVSQMKLNIRDRAQDGRFSMNTDNDKVDIRVSVIPGNHGENINMRLLSATAATVPIEELGLRGAALEAVKKEINEPHGMILNTGPTGSGKTTTLYSLLKIINDPSKKVITVEDPIEYSLPGVIQTEVSKDGDYTFGKALRAIVRQDPDIILVGEIRDEETAEVAINAALTGHLVFSTLHTNNAAASIARLLELGIKPSLISSAVNIFIAQRLVRRLCAKCKAAYAPADKAVEALKKLLANISPQAKVAVPQEITVLYQPVGCPECHFTGYQGRLAIFEVFRVSKRISDVIADFGTENQIREAALADGMMTMSQDGILKVLEGITTMDEVWRSAGKEEGLESLYEDLVLDLPKNETGQEEKKQQNKNEAP